MARRIAQELGLDETEAKVLELGSAWPGSGDSFSTTKNGQIETIESIVRSRILFLEGNVDCFRFLGNALQTIQNRWIQDQESYGENASWELQANKAEILSESELCSKIGSVGLSSDVEQTYLAFLDKIAPRIARENDDEIRSQRNAAFEDLLDKIIAFASTEPTSSMNNLSLNLNIAFRICLKLSRWVVIPAELNVHASSQISIYKEELRHLRSKLRGFPNSYLEKIAEVVKLEEIANIKDENLAQVNDAYEKWILSGRGLLDYAIFPSYGNSIEDLRERFRLTLKLEARERIAGRFTNSFPLPDIKIDFSTFEQAKYAEEVFFEILLRQYTEKVSDRVGFIIDNLLNAKFPADPELSTGILDDRKNDLEKDVVLTNVIRGLRRIYEPSWNDVNELRKRLAHIHDAKLEVLTN